MNKRPASIDEPVVAININQTFRPGMSTGDLYDYTRGIWRLSRTRAEQAQYAFAVYRGIIKEVYKIGRWFPAGETKYRERKFDAADLENRYEFIGTVAPDKIREKYVNRVMPERYYGNPIRYYNC
ncbi:MAG TPA: hypothetical protein VF658_11480 [Pyrinomonadaceae bacterium]|jgi:hypothetical protein